ncbi:MAG: phosphoglycerate dehydrogenase [Rhodospirillales bacterium]
MTRVAVCSRSFSRHPVLRAEILDRYPDTKFNDAGIALAGMELVDFLADCDKAVIALEPIDREILDRLPNLRVIAKYGVGFDKLDLDAMRARNIHLGWTPGVNRRAVSELALCFMISLLRQVGPLSRAVADGTWSPAIGGQLTDKTVGIVGCGNVGQDLAGILRAMGVQVLAHDLLEQGEFYKKSGVKPLDLNSLLRSADIVTLHLPLNASTRGIISAERLALMRPGALLINTARGGLIDEEALSVALADGHLAGAAFDVFDEEPPINNRLFTQSNFIATPHIGGSTEESVLAMGRAAIHGLDTFSLPEPGVFPR